MPYFAHRCRRCQHADTMAQESSQFGSVARGMAIDSEVVTRSILLRKSCGMCPACKGQSGCDWDPIPGLVPQWTTEGQPVSDDVLYPPGYGTAWPDVTNEDPRHKARVSRACACDSCRRRYEDETGEPAPPWEYAGPEAQEEAP
jgi:hypothetical protein